MISLIRYSIPYLFVTAVALAVCCTRSDTIAGGGASGTSNGILGVAVRPDGTPAAGAVVRVRESDYFADTSARTGDGSGADTVCGGDGAFWINGLEQGSYVLEITDDTALCTMVPVMLDAAVDTAALDTVILDSGAVLRGTVRAVGYATIPRVFVRAVGLERITHTDTAGRFVFPLVPRGVLSLQLVSADTLLPTTMLDSVTVSASETDVGVVTIEPRQRAAAVMLNTTATGAGVSENVHGFPAAVRLNGSVVDFAQVGTGGNGLRFFRGANELYHDVECWPQSAGDTAEAVVWVRLDTLHGDSVQELLMTWVDTLRSAYRSPARVFDTANGFMGVWHLDEDADDVGTPGLYRDATSFGRHGADSVTDTGKQGRVGRGQCFTTRGYDCIPVTPSVRPSSAFTISAWFKPDSATFTSGEPFRIFGTYDWNGGNPLGFVMQINRGDLDFVAGDGTVHEGANAWNHVEASWMHYAVVYRPGAGTVSMYLNGVPVPLDDPDTKPSIVYGPDTPTYISAPAGQPFKGAIDEVRVGGRARSAAWVRLCYENQKEGQTLVTVEKAGP